MLKCQNCGKELHEKDALAHTNNETKEQAVICHACFKEETGVDYKTFQYRRESAKQGCFAVIFCLCATVYGFLENGAIYGLLGLAATALIYFFTIRPK